jgi:hypothetical protein
VPRYPVTDVIPQRLAALLTDEPYWFVIGGHAVRCFCPYRPSEDVDLGVDKAKDSEDLVRQLKRKARVEVLERAEDTIHLSVDGIAVSVFVLRELRPHSQEHALTVTGVLATKVHAILDRGLRRDFFDLYVMLQHHGLGIIECIRALRDVYGTDVNEGLILRALCYFDDAQKEATLPNEGPGDWKLVKSFFQSRAGALLVPPERTLDIQGYVVDVHPRRKKVPSSKKKRRRSR